MSFKYLLFALFLFSSEASAQSLKSQIDRILGHSKLARSPISIQIRRLNDGSVLYEKNPTLSLNPASNAKIITAATALHELGPNYTFKTEFFSDTLIDSGSINNLWIKGFGDPLFVTEELKNVVQRFRAAGLRRIEGQIFIDDTYFDRYHRTTYLSSVKAKTYSILTSPLSFNWNKMRMGNLDPATYAGTMIMEAMQQRGITIAGGLHREAVPRGVISILSHSSPPLKQILKGMGKQSNNFIAEQLVKAIAAHHFGPPGSTAQGVTLMSDYLVSLGFSHSHFRLDNGSGLSRLSRLSSEQIVAVLLDLYHSPWRDDFISSLSISGVDGTMRRKMKKSPLKGRSYAKTGTLNDVNTLSGYLFDEKQGVAYSLLFNDFSISALQITAIQQRILEAVMKDL